MGEKLESAKSFARYCQAYQAGVGIWQVNSTDKSYEVNLVHRTCTCYRWHLCGVPCQHACAAIFKAKERPENYVDDFFKKDAYRATYAHMIFPIPHEDEWVKTSSPDIDPLKFRKQSGRPKKARRRGADEPGPSTSRARKGTVQCGNCGGTGHNVRGCSKPLIPYLALRVRGHVPMATGTATGSGTSTTSGAAAPVAHQQSGTTIAARRGRGTRQGRASTPHVQESQASTSSAGAATQTAMGRRRGRGMGSTEGTRVYGRSSRGRIYSWFNIASDATARDSNNAVGDE